jgi:hypothetical protein
MARVRGQIGSSFRSQEFHRVFLVFLVMKANAWRRQDPDGSDPGRLVLG